MVEEEGAGFEGGGAGVEVDVFAHAAAHVIVGELHMGVIAGGVWHAAGHRGEAVFAVVGVSPEAVLREVSVKVVSEGFRGRAGEGVAGFGEVLAGGGVIGGDGDGLQVSGVGRGVFRRGFWHLFVIVVVEPGVGRGGRIVGADGDLRGGVVRDAADGQPPGGGAVGVLVEAVGVVGVGRSFDGFGDAVADGVEGVAEGASGEDGV